MFGDVSEYARPIVLGDSGNGLRDSEVSGRGLVVIPAYYCLSYWRWDAEFPLFVTTPFFEI